MVLGPVVAVASYVACGVIGIGGEQGFKSGFFGSDDAFTEEDLMPWDAGQKEVDEDWPWDRTNRISIATLFLRSESIDTKNQ